VGPTGCGKSTTLALISGLEPPSLGEVKLFQKPVKGVQDGVGYMFQTDAVFPWRDALSNVVAGPRFHGVNKAEAAQNATDCLKGAYTIDLPRPRNVAEIRFDGRFVQLYQEIWEDLREEVLVSYERAKHRIAS